MRQAARSCVVCGAYLHDVVCDELEVHGEADVLVQRKAEARRVVHLVALVTGGRVRHIIGRDDLTHVPRLLQVLERLLVPVAVPAHVREGLTGHTHPTPQPHSRRQRLRRGRGLCSHYRAA